MIIKLRNVRLSFPHIFEPQVDAKTGNSSYNAAFILMAGDPQIKMVQEAIKEAAKEKWKDRASAMLKTLALKDDLCLHDGDTKVKYPEFHGNMFVSARSPSRPRVLDRNKTPLTAKDGRPYAGCYVNVALDIWAQDNEYGQRVNAGLGGVQFFKDGASFSGAYVATDDDFEEFGDDDDDADFL